MLIVLAVLLASVLSQAQGPSRVPRIGFIVSGAPGSIPELITAFRQELRNLGYQEGQSIEIDFRWHPPQQPDLLPGIASELIRSGVDVLVGSNTPTIVAFKQATKTIPIVMIAPGDPVGTGLIESFARPGGNVTGMTLMTRDIQGKRLQLLKEIVPKMSRVADLWNPLNPATQRDFSELEITARTLGVAVHSTQVRTPNELSAALPSITAAHADALIVQADPLTLAHAKQIADFAARNRLASMFYMREYVDVGGLVSYGASLTDQYRRSARYVDRILKGVKPADLPVEQPTKFELVINLKTAKALGITIPESILLRADELIR